jgi:restriction system protein
MTSDPREVQVTGNAWLVRGGRAGERDQWALDNSIAGIGFHEVPDISGVPTWDEMKEFAREHIPAVSPQAATNYAAQLWAFKERISVGDTVVLPIKNTPYIAIGRVKGEYKYDAKNSDPSRRHTRAVEWTRTDVPRIALRQDLLHSLGAFLTVCKIERNDGAWRLEQVLSTGKDPGSRTQLPSAEKGAQTVDADENLSDETTGIDVVRYSKDRIASRIGETFAGHRLADLIASVLEAEGYRCFVSPPGPDNGVDILAGTGLLGLSSPRIVVQVKSQTSPVSNDVVSQLQGTVAMHKADQGLLVAWGGVTKAARNILNNQYFQIAIWDSDRVIEEVFKHYESLPESIQLDLPLQRTWALVENED